MMAAVEEAHVGLSSAELSGEEPEAQEEHSSNPGEGSGDGGTDEASDDGGTDEASDDGGTDEASDDGGTDDEASDDGGTDEGASDDGGTDEGASDGGENKEAADGEEAENEDGGEGGGDANQNAGWADAMAKILGKKIPESKPTILLKNKQLDKLKEKEKQEQLERKKQFDKKRAWEMICRDKPDLVKNRDMERHLQRIATRGVVQLFNAVRTHQKHVDEKVKEVGGSERKKAKLLSSISKKDFINVLRGTEGGSDVTVKKERQTSQAGGAGGEEEKPAWSVLRDDFMMGASMKDWDKESDGEDGDAPETQQAAEDSDSD